MPERLNGEQILGRFLLTLIAFAAFMGCIVWVAFITGSGPWGQDRLTRDREYEFKIRNDRYHRLRVLINQMDHEE